MIPAAGAADLPIVVSFTVEADGGPPTGQALGEAITSADGAAAYFMLNCAHPNHFAAELRDSEWARSWECSTEVNGVDRGQIEVEPRHAVHWSTS